MFSVKNAINTTSIKKEQTTATNIKSSEIEKLG